MRVCARTRARVCVCCVCVHVYMCVCAHARARVCVVHPFIPLYYCRRCYDFTVLNSTIQPPVQPCCESSVSSWFINFELFSTFGFISNGDYSIDRHDTSHDRCYSTVFIPTGFVCQHNTFLIYSSLKKRTVKRFMTSVCISVGVILILFALMAVPGYVAFMDKTNG